jgi:hypothetical protein
MKSDKQGIFNKLFYFLKNNFLVLFFLLLVILIIFLVILRSIEKDVSLNKKKQVSKGPVTSSASLQRVPSEQPTNPEQNVSSEQPIASEQSVSSEQPLPVARLHMTKRQMEEQILSIQKRLSYLEQQQQYPQMTNYKLIAAELIRGVLENKISIRKLKVFLERINEPWADEIQVRVNPIKNCSTMSQLKTLLFQPTKVLSRLEENLTGWQRLKRKVKSLFNDQKIEVKDGAVPEYLEKINKALNNNDLQGVMDGYESLSPEMKQVFFDWYVHAQERLFIEEILSHLLSDLAQGGS